MAGFDFSQLMQQFMGGNTSPNTGKLISDATGVVGQSLGVEPDNKWMQGIQSSVSPAFDIISGGMKAVKAAKTASTAASGVQKASNMSTFLKGGLGTVGGVTGLATTALNIASGLEKPVDTKGDTWGNILNIGSGVAPLLLGATNPVGLALAGLNFANKKFGSTSKEADFKAGEFRNQMGQLGISGYDSLGDDFKYSGDTSIKRTWTGEVAAKKKGIGTGELNKRAKLSSERRAGALAVGAQQTENKLMAANSAQDILNQNLQRQNNISSQAIGRSILAKNGGEIKNLLKKFSLGGSIDKNVIPSGALHAHKHNLDLDVTTKGIPVISLEEGGDVVQHAEIEREEIIYHKLFSEYLENKLTEYENETDKNEKDKILIEVGKKLTYEIMENTIDNVGLIDKMTENEI